MAIRPPRAPRRRTRPNQTRDVIVVFAVAALVVLFLLRTLMATAGVESWTVAWQLVDAPTAPLVELLDSVNSFRRPLVGRLTVSDVLAAGVAWIVALVVLAALGTRRSP